MQVELANGEVLVATGSHGPPTCTRYLSSAELYNPATGVWTYTGSTLVPRESATAIRLADGRVLLAGGYDGGGSACTDTDPVDTEIYNPATGQWSPAGNLPHGWLGGAMVLLPDHRVLLINGSQTGSSPFAEAVIFNPATGQWSEAARPILPPLRCRRYAPAGRQRSGLPGRPAAKRDLPSRDEYLVPGRHDTPRQ